MQRLITALLVAGLAFAFCAFPGIARAAANGTTYYVDYDSGDDAAAGTSPDAAFKHAPGDPQARGVAAGVTLRPGDTVLFRGGVVYRGSFEVRQSGEREAPIAYDGNSDGAFGEGRAILDGGQLVTGWQRCASAEDCGGNSNWRRIYRARVPAHPDNTAQGVGLVQGERLLYVAQYPNPAEPFYDGNQSRYLAAPGPTSRTQITDPRLAAIGGEHLVGAWAYVRTTSNFVDFRPITAYDPDTHTITFEQANRDTTGRYAIANSLHDLVLDGPGQYVFVEAPENGEHWIYVWPWDDAELTDTDVTYNVRPTAIDFGRRDIRHVRVEGFEIRHFHRAITGRDVENIIIHNNEITRIRGTREERAIAFTNVRDLFITDNHIHHAQRTNAVQTHTGTNVVYARNRIEMVARSPLRFYRVERGQMIDNVITNCRGVHSNALTIYVDSSDILVARNIVHRSNIALTLQNTQRIYVINNILTSDGAAVGLWPGHISAEYYFLNNYISSIFVNDAGARDFVLKNNIIGKIDGYPLDDSHLLAHNLYLEAKTSLNEGEFFVEQAGQVVRDPGNEDFRPVVAGPTIDMGTDVSGYYPRDTFPDFDFEVDLSGEPRVHGDATDIGPYERAYEPGELAARPPVATGADAEPGKPIDNYHPVEGAEPIIIPATSFTGEGGGSVRIMEPASLARHDFVRGWNESGHWLEYTVHSPAGGEFRLALRYAAEFEAPREAQLNGRTIGSVTLPATGGWSSFDTFEFDAPVTLRAGENTLRLTSLGGRGCNLDELRLSRPGEADIVVTGGAFTAEGGHGGEAVRIVPSPHHGLIYFWNDEGHWLEWSIEDAEAGTYAVMLRYATLMNSPREVSVNGRVVEHLEQVTLDRTEGWRVLSEAVLPAPIELVQGRNVLRLTSRGGQGLNVDEIRLIRVAPAR